jgi:hypothetical protein
MMGAWTSVRNKLAMFILAVGVETEAATHLVGCIPVEFGWSPL